jgi:hypothetical protein
VNERLGLNIIVTRAALMAVSRKFVAHHEAGHAVAAQRLGLRLFAISIVAEGVSAGHVVHTTGLGGAQSRFLSPAQTVRLHNNIIVSFAGPAAGHRYSSRLHRPSYYRADERAANLMAARIEPEDETRFALLRYLGVKAEQLVKAEWPIIRRLAAMLLIEPKMTGRRLQEAIWEARKAEDPRLAVLDELRSQLRRT